ncbi:hypothetical protein EVA_09719 [gut metagenome]|uniref:Uncharacterized protein n=1 Tax=gut metagenome TaxID=749906 RepID=J9GJH3_9ZZZZ
MFFFDLHTFAAGISNGSTGIEDFTVTADVLVDVS